MVVIGDVLQHAHNAVLSRAQALHLVECVLINAFYVRRQGRAVTLERCDHRRDGRHVVVRSIRDLSWLSAQCAYYSSVCNFRIDDVTEHFLHGPAATPCAKEVIVAERPQPVDQLRPRCLDRCSVGCQVPLEFVHLSPRTTLPARRSQETRQRILDAAYQVFVRSGFGGASVDEIIAEADVSKGALYHHFSGKAEIFQAILADHVRQCADQMAAVTDPGVSLRENIERILAVSWQEAQEDAAWPALQMEFWVHATRDEHARSVVVNAQRECRQLVSNMVASLQQAGVLRQGLDPDVAARLFVALNDGILLQWQVEPDDVKPETLVGPMAAMIECFLSAR